MKNNLIAALCAAMAGALQGPILPMSSNRRSYTPSDTRTGRSMRTAKYGNWHNTSPHQGAREIARRKSQIERGILHVTPK